MGLHLTDLQGSVLGASYATPFYQIGPHVTGANYVTSSSVCSTAAAMETRLTLYIFIDWDQSIWRASWGEKVHVREGGILRGIGEREP